MLDVILLNAGAMIYLSGQVKSILEGIEEAKSCIKTQEALNILRGLENGKFVKSV